MVVSIVGFPVSTQAIQLDAIAPPLSLDAVPFTPGLTTGPTPIIVNTRVAVQLGKALFWEAGTGCSGMACASCHFLAGADHRATVKSALHPESGHPPRNAPSIINAVFNFRNFHDGRANNRFNGQNPYGARDGQAGVFEWRQGQVVKTRILLENAALASQAMEPPVNPAEMACRGQTFPDIARRLLRLRPLEHQTVHPEDSVLADIRAAQGKGLSVDYAELIRKSFAPRFWEATEGDFGRPRSGGQPYKQMEANFAFFFGLAIQMYESTLISNQTRFDSPRDTQGYPSAYRPEERRGLDVFNRAECDFCHRGPVFSAATHPALFSESGQVEPLHLVERRVLRVDRKTRSTYTPLSDVGYANIGVTPSSQDVGLGGTDPHGQPLSFAAQYLTTLAYPEHRMPDPVTVIASTFSLGFRVGFAPEELRPPFLPEGIMLKNPRNAVVPNPETTRHELARPHQGRLPLGVRGSFKVPGLRNVELTGPYMHNGSLGSLEAVIEFYNRGGNVANPERFATFVFPQQFTAQQKSDLLAFLKSLTDERVRREQAPFDHPSLRVFNRNRWLDIPAVGSSGKPVSYHAQSR